MVLLWWLYRETELETDLIEYEYFVSLLHFWLLWDLPLFFFSVSGNKVQIVAEHRAWCLMFFSNLNSPGALTRFHHNSDNKYYKGKIVPDLLSTNLFIRLHRNDKTVFWNKLETKQQSSLNHYYSFQLLVEKFSVKIRFITVTRNKVLKSKDVLCYSKKMCNEQCAHFSLCDIFSKLIIEQEGQAFFLQRCSLFLLTYKFAFHLIFRWEH